MSLPHTIPLQAGGAVIVSATGKHVHVVCPPNMLLTRDEAEYVADMLCIVGAQAERHSGARMITSVDDERVRGAS